MRYLLWLFRIALFILLFGFALKNADPVSLRFFFGFNWRTPLDVLLLSAIAVGALFGLLAAAGVLLRQRRELQALRQQLAATEQATAAKTGADQTSSVEAPQHIEAGHA